MALNDVFTKKQQEVLKEIRREDWFISVLHGAVRSGKTYLNNFIFLMEIKRVSEIAAKKGVKNPMYILAGYSMSSIQDNVLTELSNVFGLTLKFDRYNSFELFGVKIIQTTHGNKTGVGRIRGMTSYGAYINEASLAVESVFEEIKTRCSGEGARIIADTNPDYPEHWLKKNYIDKAGENSDIREFQFTLDDNTFLDERYVRNLKAATPSGMFYDRSILGEWVSAKGVIYPDFDQKRDVVTSDSYQWWNADEIICGVDWGYSHYGSIVVMARFGMDWVLVAEYAEQFRDINYWVDVARNVKETYGRFGNIPFYCDSARPEHIDRFIQEGFNAQLADKSILSGIEMVARLMVENHFKVIDGNCPQFMQEIYKYQWNDRNGMPLKENDDVMDAIRYAIYTHRHSAIEWNISPRLF